MKGWELFSSSLNKLGLDPVFGNPGSTELPMLRGIESYFLTLHDGLSVGMADGLEEGKHHCYHMFSHALLVCRRDIADDNATVGAVFH